MATLKRRSSLSEKREQFHYLLQKIENHEVNFPFDVITPELIVSQIGTFITFDNVFIQKKFEAQTHNQLRLSDQKKLMKLVRTISQYLKVKFHSNNKKLGEWGITLVLSKTGIVQLPSRLLEQQELAAAILLKHQTDGDTSVLNRFDMDEFELLYNNVVSNKTAFKAAQIVWRSKSQYRKQALNTVEKSLARLARDLRCNLSLLPKDLEEWGFVIIEYHKTDNEELDMAS